MIGNHVQLACRRRRLALPPGYEGDRAAAPVDPQRPRGGHRAAGRLVVRIDPDGKTFTRRRPGFRNAYDLAFNRDGELFTFDSDMEWDSGRPGTAPTRVVHVLTAAATIGWRTGSADWPAWYPDSLPPLMDLGRGSPTGVAWCDSPAFPPDLAQHLLLGDWAQGRVFAVHLQPDGVSWRGRSEVLLSGPAAAGHGLRVRPLGRAVASRSADAARSGALLRLRGTEEAPADRATTGPRGWTRHSAGGRGRAHALGRADFEPAQRSRPHPPLLRSPRAGALARRLVPCSRAVSRLPAYERRGAARARAQALAAGEAASAAELLPQLAPCCSRRAIQPPPRRRAGPGDRPARRPARHARRRGSAARSEHWHATATALPFRLPALDRELAALLARTEPDGARTALSTRWTSRPRPTTRSACSMPSRRCAARRVRPTRAGRWSSLRH